MFFFRDVVDGERVASGCPPERITTVCSLPDLAGGLSVLSLLNSAGCCLESWPPAAWFCWWSARAVGLVEAEDSTQSCALGQPSVVVHFLGSVARVEEGLAEGGEALGPAAEGRPVVTEFVEVRNVAQALRSSGGRRCRGLDPPGSCTFSLAISVCAGISERRYW
jgi:hypothetical protein